MAVDRRRSDRERRAALRVPAVFAVKSEGEGCLWLGQAEDVGPGGLTMRRLKDPELAPGTGLTLTFALPGDRAVVSTHAVVVTDQLVGACRRTGVRFLALPDDQEQQIAAFCQQLSVALYPAASVA
jgi:c-di-GMP-binding flagellar brake protein YcgR